MWWQVKDSNLRSFRDGFTVHGRQGRDQPKRLSYNNFRAYSPQVTSDSRLQPDTPVGLEQSLDERRSCGRYGSPTAGWVGINVQGPAGATVTVTYGEKLRTDGTVDNTDAYGMALQ